MPITDQTGAALVDNLPAQAVQPLRPLLPDDYRAERSHIFPSADSFRWFVRQNRAELVAAGALICPTGRWLVQPDAFDATVLSVGQRRAKRAV